MNTDNRTKINQLLDSHPQGTVFLASWLSNHGYSLDLLKIYRKNKWLKSIGTGAMIRHNDQVNYEGAIYALQKQANLTVHIGGKTALSYLGKSHYLDLSGTRVMLFGYKDEKLPAWFLKHQWDVKTEYHSSSFLPAETGLVDLEFKTFSMQISGAARAMLECLYLVPKKQQLLECYQIMEGLNNLRPKIVQTLLEECRSIKVKRLFLYLANKAGHQWVQYLNLDNIDLGTGKRSIVKNGVYIHKYQITVPKELEDCEETNL
ncbi:type IV toxin-antitoxin system AbiEi family antitoxin [Aquimarina macrocephali]|uniref:type IV toxin-antitoxin system AbiEi family antitoxin n=1 Tax=Aquimarina macrocephali TaxID=666563 RepID=UPI0004666761|nr:type IV toxin-antitoxin system AbiEi family antitoxin [Aquimarina macrocephali]